MTILVIEHEDEAPIGILGERWREVGHVLDIRRPYLGDDQPAYLGPEHDALVVPGGYMGANDDAEHGWLTQTKALLADTTRRGEQPVLGICLETTSCSPSPWAEWWAATHRGGPSGSLPSA